MNDLMFEWPGMKGRSLFFQDDSDLGKQSPRPRPSLVSRQRSFSDGGDGSASKAPTSAEDSDCFPFLKTGKFGSEYRRRLSLEGHLPRKMGVTCLQRQTETRPITNQASQSIWKMLNSASNFLLPPAIPSHNASLRAKSLSPTPSPRANRSAFKANADRLRAMAALQNFSDDEDDGAEDQEQDETEEGAPTKDPPTTLSIDAEGLLAPRGSSKERAVDEERFFEGFTEIDLTDSMPSTPVATPKMAKKNNAKQTEPTALDAAGTSLKPLTRSETGESDEWCLVDESENDGKESKDKKDKDVVAR